MISKSFSTSAKRDAIYQACPKLAEFCEFLFVMLITHADDHGRLPGDEFTVKMQVDPIAPRKLSDFAAALQFLHGVGLICWYHVDGRKVIEIERFREHQDLKGHGDRPSKFLPCPGQAHWVSQCQRGIMGELSPKTAHWGNLGSEEKGIEEKGRELNLTGGTFPQNCPLQEGESRFERFWMAYPKKRSKDAARKAFHKRAVSDDLLTKMLEAIEQRKQTRDWQKDNGEYIPHPATWLNAAGWEDEIAVEIPQIAKSTDRLMRAGKAFLDS